MKVFSIKITLLILIIVAAIIATGYLSYKNLSQIVQSIHREARPDYKLIKIKEINADLSEVDNSVRLYSLTKEPKYLRPYDRTISSVDKRVDELLILQGNDTSQVANIHAIQQLIGKKIVVWDKILKLHSKPVEKEVFDQFYTTIEKKTTDSVAPPKDNLLKRIFKKKKDKEITLGKEEVTQEVAKLERSLSDKAVQQAETETQLLKKSNRLTSQLQFLILQLEQKETESLFLKSLEAEVLAENTYKWLAVFCVAAVLLLITVLLIILNYSRKSSQSQRALTQAKTEADNLVKAKELFTANVSHELRTPMNAIYGLTEQLLQQPMESKLKDQLRVILKSADYLNKVVNDILDFSKIQAGKLTIEQIPFNLPDVFREVCALNQVIANQKKLDFRCDFNDNIPSYVTGDPTRLRQILLNLLNNAFKFTERGYVSISAETKTKDDASAMIAITITDTGIGIPSDKLDNIFDDYTQAEQSVSRKYGGTGLGLSIVKRLMDLLQGSIEVSSVEHQGTTFTCNIPFSLSNIEAIPETGHEAAVVVPSELQGISVLVADDEEYNRMLLTTIFNKWNFKFRCVSNGQDAIQLMYDNYFDIVLMDIRMPGMNGFEATREILEAMPNTRIIALSAGNSPDDIKRCKEAGMIDFLLKPFSERDLLSMLVKTIDGCALPPVKEASPVNIPVENDEIRLEELYKVSAGDEHFVEEMLSLFLKTTHDGIEKLNLYYKENDWEGISNTAHKMASPCRHLGVMNLYRNLKELESMENNTADLSRAKTLIDSVQRQVSTITSQIEQRIVLSTK